MRGVFNRSNLFKGGASFVDPFCYLCFMFVFVMLSYLFLAALRSPVGIGLTSWLSCVLYFLVFLSLFGILGQVWYLIVLIPDLCLPLYLVFGGRSLLQINEPKTLCQFANFNLKHILTQF